MFAVQRFTIRGKALATILAMIGWLSLALCWTVLAWSRYSFFQNLVGLGISTLLFVAVVGVMWVAEQGRTLVLTVLTTLGWLSLALYWIGFAWSRHTLLLNGAILIGSLLAWMTFVVLLWVAQPVRKGC
jgi:hypothetical protein